MKSAIKTKDNLTFYFLVLILALILYFFINQFAYFDAPNLCYISLTEDVINGNKKTMHQAISLLKRTNREDYKNLCRYVHQIAEKNCFAFDPRVESRSEKTWQPGCFVKGSKTIYIKPAKERSELMIKKRSEEIKKFMLISKNYWENKNYRYFRRLPS